MKKWLSMLLSLGVTAGQAAIVEQPIEYLHEGTTLQGYLYFEDSVSSQRPGVLVVHEWQGLGDYTKSRARQLAQLGYVAFAADMYGKGVYGTTHDDAAKLAAPYFKERQLMRGRVRAGYDALIRSPQVDPSRTAAMGYCFGGTAVLELARSGAPLKAVVSFHGVLSTPNPADAAGIRGEVLALTGADDPHVTPDQVQAFMTEMRAAHIVYGLVAYPGAVHSFTVPTAGNDPTTGMAYNAQADKKAWNEMKELFDRTLQKSQ